MAAPVVQPIIVIKKKGHHGGHHGGAWKVAYADFVTAMMALFMVMWLMNASPEVKKAVGGYFKDPKGSGKKTGTNVAGAGDSLSVSKTDMKDLKDKLEHAIKKQPDFQKLKDNVEITITGEGLRIELLETEKGMFFNTGAPTPTPLGKDLLAELARQLGKLSNPLMIEGHTDATAYGSTEYTNWELSADRANAARRIMQGTGLEQRRITQVRGFADQRLRKVDDPKNASNRRVSIVVRYADDVEPAEKQEVAKAGEGKGTEPKGESKMKGEKGIEKATAVGEKAKPGTAAEAKAPDGKAAAHA